ncbi:MAG: hypothetical protein Kow0047_19820 [Anaerolineae bacterium]
MRLGFPVKVFGRPGMKSHDSRPPLQRPHLSVSLAYLRDILLYLQGTGITMYRMAEDLAPELSRSGAVSGEPIDACAPELERIGDLAMESGIRLSFHPTTRGVLSSPDEAVTERARAFLGGLARILDLMRLGPEAVIVVHVGGVYGDREAALARWASRFLALPASIRSRLAVENDDALFSIADVYALHLRTGVRVVFDYLHHLNHNPDQVPLVEALDMALSTWPEGERPKIHFASPRTTARTIRANGQARLHPPLWTQHGDFVNPFEFAAFLEAADGCRPFDVMLEARARDLAVIRLRADLARHAPHLSSRLADATPCLVAEPDEPYLVQAPPDEQDARVLVVIMNNARDFARARDEGWYRIPVARAPRQIGADYLAFYQTRVFGDEAWAIHYIAPVRAYRLVTRRELLPEEPDHPRADQAYYKIEIGPLERLKRPVPSKTWRRITFIPTTMARLLEATDVIDLVMPGDIHEQLRAAVEEEPIGSQVGEALETGSDL